jgi:hypothetical protein
MNPLFLVTSAIHTKHGVYDTKTRLDQTIETFKSIQKYASNSKILLIECSGESSLTEEELVILQPYVSGIISFSDDPQVKKVYNETDNHDIVKSYTELYSFGRTIENLKDRCDILDDVSWIFKISGRYTLTDQFSLNNFFDKNMYYFANRRKSQFPEVVTGGLKEQLMSRLWAFHKDKISLIANRYPLMLEHFVGSLQNGKYIDIEHNLLRLFEGPYLKELPIIGVSGKLGPNGELVSD